MVSVVLSRDIAIQGAQADTIRDKIELITKDLKDP